ncbi:hypothetical protein [Pedobacter nyackensis]|uniref:Uncharacterized protein n=1 Tax=Pedobacter nyackensis TaxID=475255 RepID=A0A1W2EGF4_9SPHI|nr:hypothetical protein [Pedobacter nyackensis]SMD08416.1 hypothetical protein SAMN04488101_11222 [Pedobacter nyackensis]
MTEKGRVIQEMLTKGYRDGEFENESYLLQVLRETEDNEEIIELCGVLSKVGSMYVVPVLMARLKDADDITHTYIQLSLERIHARIKDWDAKKKDDFFDPEWWRPKWMGTKERFISYVAFLASSQDKDELFEERKMEEIAEGLIKEMDLDLSPHQSFRELKLCTPKWNLKADLAATLLEVEQELLVEPALDGANVVINEDTQVERNLTYMKNDYLLTRLKLYSNFEENLYALTIMNCLNRPDN